MENGNADEEISLKQRRTSVLLKALSKTFSFSDENVFNHQIYLDSYNQNLSIFTVKDEERDDGKIRKSSRKMSEPFCSGSELALLLDMQKYQRKRSLNDLLSLRILQKSGSESPLQKNTQNDNGNDYMEKTFVECNKRLEWKKKPLVIDAELFKPEK